MQKVIVTFQEVGNSRFCMQRYKRLANQMTRYAMEQRAEHVDYVVLQSARYDGWGGKFKFDASLHQTKLFSQWLMSRH